MKRYFFFGIIGLGIALQPLQLSAQSKDTLRIMTYNLLNYRNNGITGCTNNNNSPSSKETNLNTIISHILPEILVVNEVGTSDPAATFRLASNALNQNGRNYYGFTTIQTGNRQNINSAATGNLIYWDTRKLELKSSQYIEFDPSNNALVRVIDHYTLYYKDPNLAVHGDTIFLNVFVGHLKAGTSTSDENERDWATNALMAYIDSNNVRGNIFFGGDFNLYNSNEAAYQNMLNYSVSSHRLYDPINVPGNWSNNSPYAIVHTQSIRTSGSCGAIGGMDDRFDFILCSNEVRTGSDSVQYISGSYQAVGQDGLRFNGSLSGSPTNNSAPTAVLTAMENLSDHLPVIMDVELRLPTITSITKIEKDVKLIFNNPIEDYLNLTFPPNLSVQEVQILDISGREIISFLPNGSKEIQLNCSELKAGIYFLKVVGNHTTYPLQKLIKI